MRPMFRPGQAAYVHHLHDNRPAKVIDGPDKNGERTFELEGKRRRMLVIALKPRIRVESAPPTQDHTGKNDCTYYRAKGRLGYLVLSLQSEPPPGRWLSYPDLIDAHKISYIELRPLCYPEESIVEGSGFWNVQRAALDQIQKELTVGKLGYEWDRA